MIQAPPHGTRCPCTECVNARALIRDVAIAHDVFTTRPLFTEYMGTQTVYTPDAGRTVPFLRTESS